MKIVFIIPIDKFTKGLYRFMEKNFSYIDLFFIFYGHGERFAVDSKKQNCFWLSSYKEIRSDSREYWLAQECDLIVYSSFFDSMHCVNKFGIKTLKKTYIQLWGGDFYCLRDKKGSFKHKLSNMYRRYLIRNAAGVINLIPKDYEVLNQLCSPKGKHFVAPVCDDGTDLIIIESMRNVEKSKYPIKILLGNSATKTNQHLPAIDVLKRFKDKDILVICPLSYGDDEKYKDSVIAYGKKIMGDKFAPITSYMDKTEYYKMIANCQVAIFNNNRQQAMGNISTALALGCKVFIRKDTPMWGLYHDDREMEIYDVETISQLSFESFSSNSVDGKSNFLKYLKYSDVQTSVDAWKIVFESVK